MKRNLLRLSAAFLLAAASYMALMAFPGALFAYEINSGNLVIASDRPFSSEGAKRLAQSCERLLQQSPLKQSNRPYRIYVTSSDWLHRLFFAVSPQAGGIGYYIFGRHIFLSGADFENGLLIKGDYVVEPPRTLAYFCAHEITHIVIGENVGLLGLMRIPDWVAEGLSDYVGIRPRQSFETLSRELGEKSVDLEMMKAHGTYPRFRLLVTYFLEKRGWSIEKLLSTELSYEGASMLMRSEGG